VKRSRSLDRARDLRKKRRRLSGEDAGFLYLEQPAQPLNVLNLALLSPEVGPDGQARPITLEYLHRHIERRLDALPWLRWCVRPVPLRLHHPVYVDDHDFTLERHLRQVTLPSPGTPEQLRRFCGSLVQRHFDRRHPLWQIILVDGLDDGRQAVITRLHHCLMDGAAALRAYTIIFSDDADQSPQPAPRWLPRRPPGRWRLVVEAVADQAQATRRFPVLVLRFLASAKAHDRRIEESNVVVPKTPDDTPPSPFGNAFTRPQVLAYTALPLADLAEIRQGSGVSRNDVVLGVVAGAVREYLAARDALPDRALVTAVPLSIPTPEEPDRIAGNHILSLSTSLATDIADPWERLQIISSVAAEAKARMAIVDPELLWEWLDLIPPVVARRAAAYQYRFRRKHTTVVDQNLLVSYFRGPEETWHIGTARCDAFYWFGPPNQGVGLNISGWDFAGHFLVGIDAFADALDDADELVDRLHRSLAELVGLARSHGHQQPETGVAS
jgi:WS/DGAT/MGAT family acyltransferase